MIGEFSVGAMYILGAALIFFWGVRGICQYIPNSQLVGDDFAMLHPGKDIHEAARRRKWAIARWTTLLLFVPALLFWMGLCSVSWG